MANTKDIRRKQGDTYDIAVTILNGKDPYDLTGTTEIKLGVAQKKSLAAGDTPDLVLTGAVTTPADGTASFPLTVNEADSLNPGTYHAEIQFVQNGDIVTTDTFNYIVEGQIIL